MRPTANTSESSTDSIALAPAVEADYAQVVDRANAAYRGAAGGWTTEAGIIAGLRLTDATLRQDLADKPDAVLLVHRDPDGLVRGTVWLEPVGNEVWYLGLLTVRPEEQNAGLGRQMLSAAEDWVRAHCGTTIRMTVLNVRDTLLAWYERRGYRRTGATVPFPYDDERVGVPLQDDLCFLVLEKK